MESTPNAEPNQLRLTAELPQRVATQGNNRKRECLKRLILLRIKVNRSASHTTRYSDIWSHLFRRTSVHFCSLSWEIIRASLSGESSSAKQHLTVGASDGTRHGVALRRLCRPTTAKLPGLLAILTSKRLPGSPVVVASFVSHHLEVEEMRVRLETSARQPRPK